MATNNNYKVARSIVEEYKEYPVMIWRLKFDEIIEQLNEYDGVQEDQDFDIDQEDEDMKKQNLKKSKNLEPTLNAELKKNKI
jgi:hypothetical protein